MMRNGWDNNYIQSVSLQLLKVSVTSQGRNLMTWFALAPIEREREREKACVVKCIKSESVGSKSMKNGKKEKMVLHHWVWQQ